MDVIREIQHICESPSAGSSKNTVNVLTYVCKSRYGGSMQYPYTDWNGVIVSEMFKFPTGHFG